VGEELDRVIGRIRGDTSGPTLICVGGVHGNEPAGVQALERVLAEIRFSGLEVRGEFAALAGNLQALRQGRRYVQRDLNRAWDPTRVATLRTNGAPKSPEDLEMIELLGTIEEIAGQSRGEVFVLDLHTTSAAGGLFTTVADTMENRRFAMSIPVPLVLGLEELVDGTMLEYLGRRGYTTAVMEGGQHEDPRSVDRLEAGLWLALVAAEVVSENGLPQVAEARKSLRKESRSLPRAVEMRHRYAVEPGDEFRMRPGYRSFDQIESGEVLAYDHRGEVKSPSDSWILMPLYQEQGEDGFFLVRPFSAFWLHVSRFLRALGLDRWVHWLPGVRRDPALPGALVANRTVARWYALELFHLLGYRKHLEEDKRLVVIKREAEILDGAAAIDSNTAGV